MNWHNRYIQQAAWTRDLRAYLFDKVGLTRARRVLEVGCGTGAILADLKTSASLHGLDLDPAALNECRVHAPAAALTRGDGLALPYSEESFDIVFCHFFLLWVHDPLQALHEMKRVTKRDGHILALAEPDYSSRVDKPDELAMLGRWQTESLQRQGADVSLGARLADLFFQAGIKIIETGAVQRRGNEALSSDERENEWAVLSADLAGIVSSEEITKMKCLDETAWRNGERVLNVPTYFAWGQV
ncbi:MAG: class I SAM-dependent methyltransferase [Chloroflexi bacterium]|nr:class I SAM-dependent methyltransferase [Chloroflexota bacterium]